VEHNRQRKDTRYGDLAITGIRVLFYISKQKKRFFLAKLLRGVREFAGSC